MASLSLRRAAVPLVGAVTTVAILYPTTVLAEEPSKKPIYDTNDVTTYVPTQPTKPTPTDRLAEHIKTARLFINAHYLVGKQKLNEVFSSYLSYEHSITSTLASLAPPKESAEKVLPGAIYVAVATMAGSIVVRRRMWPVRAITPVAVGLAAGWYFLPETMTNVGALVWEYEKKVPEVAKTHLEIRKAVEETLRETKKAACESRKVVDETVAKGRSTVESWVKKG
ncbi:hypothetical protein RUND412_008979 [Rhizina undulata]